MSKYDTDKVIDFLNKCWNDAPCPMCKKEAWGAMEKVYEIREYHGGTIKPGSLIPLIPITCSNCGYTVFVNAIVSGAMEKDNNENEKN